MAAPRKTAKTTSRPADLQRQRLQLSPLAELCKRFRLAAVSLNLSETELFERLVELNFPGLHVQNLSKSPFFGAAQIGQGGFATDDADQLPAAPAVKIQTTTEKIDAIGRRASMPIDSALDQLSPDQT
jgi:hypothetical protein